MSESTESFAPKVKIEPIIPQKETIETYFKTIPDGHPDRNKFFKIRFRVPFYSNSDNDDPHAHAGNIIRKVGVDDKKRPTFEDDYYVMMDNEEFKNLYQNININVRNIQRPVKFEVIGADPIYYKKPGEGTVRKLGINDSLFVFLNPAWVSHVNPDQLPQYDPELDKTGYGSRSQE